MKIIICDDFIKDAEQAKNIISRQLNKSSYTIKIKSSQDIYVAVEEDLLNCDIIVMEIKFAEENLDGIILGSLINKKLPACQIIYYTDILEYATAVYENRHCYFLLKQDMEQVLPKAIEKAVDTYKKVAESEIIEITSKGYKCFISQKEIMYIERDDRLIQIHDVKKAYPCYMSLKQVEKKLSDDFVRCHGGYIVNLAHIVGVENLEICLSGGSRLPIGTRFYDKFKSRYLEYHVREI